MLLCCLPPCQWCKPWWLHQMETLSVLLAICTRNSPVTGEFPTQRPVTRSFDGFFDLRLNKRLSKQSWGYRAHYDVTVMSKYYGYINHIKPAARYDITKPKQWPLKLYISLEILHTNSKLYHTTYRGCCNSIITVQLWTLMCKEVVSIMRSFIMR